jgi:hypothetical protein
LEAWNCLAEKECAKKESVLRRGKTKCARRVNISLTRQRGTRQRVGTRQEGTRQGKLSRQEGTRQEGTFKERNPVSVSPRRNTPRIKARHCRAKKDWAKKWIESSCVCGMTLFAIFSV